MNTLAKVAILGGGLAWLFWDQLQGMLASAGRNFTIDDPPADPDARPVTMPAGTALPALPPAAAATTPPPPAPPPPPETPAASRPTDQVLQLAAANPPSAALAGETRLTIHAWNWYRDRYYESKGAPAPGPTIIDPQFFPNGNGETPITAQQYHQLIAGQALSGLGFVFLG